MKSFISILLLLLVNTGFCHAQDQQSTDHKVAIRLNTLGFLHLDLIGDVEYCLSDRIGIFLGAGSEFVQPVFYRPNAWFSKASLDNCSRSNWGIYGGMRVSTPLGKCKGLALRPYVFMQRINMEGNCWGLPPLHGPATTSIKSTEVGLVANIAYTQTFARRFFVEPVVGIGAGLVSASTNNGAARTHLNPLAPFQLNIGLRL
jgi:hypothetical protein